MNRREVLKASAFAISSFAGLRMSEAKIEEQCRWMESFRYRWDKWVGFWIIIKALPTGPFGELAPGDITAAVEWMEESRKQVEAERMPRWMDKSCSSFDLSKPGYVCWWTVRAPDTAILYDRQIFGGYHSPVGWVQKRLYEFLAGRQSAFTDPAER